ncbi:hypothetical protein ROHU_030598 [Labeo rohita]|uniref:Uncharacterized protein n=1 Tax=Labeo rohita TaxID=84645 RepID=A0A498L9Y7_LABRO|nr:hypothetical protein ROHU_033635 [Labeo rohita]RXN10528.1 hypothetical protein ROHU_030598 [Labeo rohita]
MSCLSQKGKCKKEALSVVGLLCCWLQLTAAHLAARRRLCGLETLHEAREQEFLQRDAVMLWESVGWAYSNHKSDAGIRYNPTKIRGVLMSLFLLLATSRFNSDVVRSCP